MHRQISGRLQLPNPLIDRGTRTLRARLVLDNAGRTLLPGTYVDVRITTAAHPALAVPRSALIRTGLDRKSVVAGKRASVRVDLGGRRLIKKKKINHKNSTTTNNRQ